MTDESFSEQSEKSTANSILLPRWVVYFQATLLGITAVTCFIFGLMVGSMTGDSAVDRNIDMEFLVTGTVQRAFDEGRQPNAGAVVLLLPDPPAEIVRQDPTTIRPDSFEPLENPTINWVQSQGGSVVRANIDGKFELFARPGVYNLLVISKTRNEPDKKLTKKQVAAISQYFIPVEKLIDGQDFYWRPIAVKDQSMAVDEIVFP